MALAAVGLVFAYRADLVRGVLLTLWLVFPVLALAVVRIPNTDNHVRYVIEALPALVLLVAHGAVVLGRRAGTRGALAAGWPSAWRWSRSTSAGDRPSPTTATGTR